MGTYSFRRGGCFIGQVNWEEVQRQLHKECDESLSLCQVHQKAASEAIEPYEVFRIQKKEITIANNIHFYFLLLK